MNSKTILQAALLAWLAAMGPAARSAVAAPAGKPVPATGDIGGTVRDSASGAPLPGGEVRVSRAGTLVASTITDAFGRYAIHNLPEGAYTAEARYLGFRAETHDVTVRSNGEPARADFHLVPLPVNLAAVEVTTTVPLAVDTRTGDQVFKQNDYHGAPTNTTSQILQQSIVGAARAPTGEVHIRGQHAEYTYYVDGVPVTSGISGSLNELFDPAVVNQIDFQTGGWDAEYGGKNAAIVNINTRVPAGGFHLDASGYDGSFNANGQGLNLSTNAGKWGFFASGARQGTAMRREPIVFDSLRHVIKNFHNDGSDLFGFGKVQYVPSEHDVVTLDLNRSRTRFAVPFDSGAGVTDDHQQDVNGFVNLAWRHRSAESPAGGSAELFTGAFFRDGSLLYTPGPNDQPSFTFAPDTTLYNLREDRAFHTWGLKLDFTHRVHHGLEFKFGAIGSVTAGHEAFTSTSARGNPGPSSVSDLKGDDLGIYGETAIAPSDKWELRTGVRFDNHNAPFAETQHQVSPRVKFSLFPDPANTVYAYYGRLFMPTNVEDLRAITSSAQGGVATIPTLPERDDFFEVGFIHRFPIGIVTKLSGYYKHSTPGIDDNTVPGSAIVTSVNIAQVHITGIELVAEVRPAGPVSGYINLALNHAYGHGPVTGGFFPAVPPAGDFDLDHDQRLSGAAGVVYSSRGFYLSATGLYGSGLTNGKPPDATYGTGLLDFNQAMKVDPSFILNASVGYTFSTGGVVLRPQLYVENMFDKAYALKGPFFSGSSFGRPRSVQVRLNIGV
jgi:hypothetical protein